MKNTFLKALAIVFLVSAVAQASEDVVTATAKVGGLAALKAMIISPAGKTALSCGGALATGVVAFNYGILNPWRKIQTLKKQYVPASIKYVQVSDSAIVLNDSITGFLNATSIDNLNGQMAKDTLKSIKNLEKSAVYKEIKTSEESLSSETKKAIRKEWAKIGATTALLAAGAYAAYKKLSSN